MSCTSSEALAHFGHKEDIRTDALIGFWPNDGTVMQKLRKLPDVIEQYCTGGAKIQVIFDYDPNYPLALAQIRGVNFSDVLAAIPHAMGNRTATPQK